VKVVWSALAEQRALEAVEYIAQDRPLTAAVWLDKLLELVGNLSQFEQQGRVVQEIGLPAYREVLHSPYRVIYRVNAAAVRTSILHRTSR